MAEDLTRVFSKLKFLAPLDCDISLLWLGQGLFLGAVMPHFLTFSRYKVPFPRVPKEKSILT